jgi:hypothetical protein
MFSAKPGEEVSRERREATKSSIFPSSSLSFSTITQRFWAGESLA